MNLLKYSNGVGHLVMSILFAFIGLALVIWPSTDTSTKAVGIALILTVSGAWFVPGAAKQVASEVQNVTTQSVVTSAPDKADLDDTLHRIPVVKKV